MKQVNETEPISSHHLERTGSQTGPLAGVAPKWAAILGILAIGVIYMLLPDRLIIGPSWLLLVIEVVFLLPIVVSMLLGFHLPHITTRILQLVLLGIITLALAIGLAFMITRLPHNNQGSLLLRSAGLLWCFNILIFGLWYWEVDGGGPIKRHLSRHQAADFMFPQQANGNDGSWAPQFVDYLFLAFTGATALSPADTFPLSRRAKGLMMLEALLSLVIIVLLAARAVNILGS